MALGKLDPGEIVGGDFKVVSELAEGGMGAVYVAEQLSTGKRRALKLMHPQFALDAQARARFVQEARVGARIAPSGSSSGQSRCRRRKRRPFRRQVSAWPQAERGGASSPLRSPVPRSSVKVHHRDDLHLVFGHTVQHAVGEPMEDEPASDAGLDLRRARRRCDDGVDALLDGRLESLRRTRVSAQVPEERRPGLGLGALLDAELPARHLATRARRCAAGPRPTP